MLRLEHNFYLWALILIPVFVGLYLLARQRRRKSLQKFADSSLIEQLMPDSSKFKPIIRLSILMLSLALVIIGIANPQIGTKIEKAERSGVDVMIALDISRSMLCEDIKPNRLTRAKQSVSRLIDKLQNDRIGIVAFAGEAYLQLPMTTDYSAAKLFLNTIDTDLIPAQGTAIGAAIELAVKSFREDDDKHKALIIITDGENHEDDAVGYASEAASKGVIIHTIGMGTVNGGPIPIMQNGNRVDFAKDNEGNVIMTKADPTMLQQLAQSGKGKFIRASETDPELSLLLDEIAGMEKRKFESKLYTDYEDRFQYFFFAALVLMIGEIFLSERRNKYLSSLNLFGDKK